MRRIGLAALTTLLGAVVGCSEARVAPKEKPPPPPRPDVIGVDGPARAPERFALIGPAAWPFSGATATHLVGLGGAYDGPGTQASPWGQVVDLTTGDAVAIAPPTDDDLSVLGATFGDDRVVIVGRDGDDGSAASFALDPVTAEWSALRGFDLPTELEPTSTVFATGTNGAVALADRSDGTSPMLAVLDDGADEWRLVPDGPPHRLAIDSCATDEDWWQLRSGPEGAVLTATSIVDGATRRVESPWIADPASTAVLLACSASSATVAQSKADGTAVETHTTDDGGRRWQAGESLVDDGPPWLSRTHSSAGRALVRGYSAVPGTDGMGDDHTDDISVVVSPDGTVAPLPIPEHSTVVMWRGRSGPLLVLGPEIISHRDRLVHQIPVG